MSVTCVRVDSQHTTETPAPGEAAGHGPGCGAQNAEHQPIDRKE